MKRILLPLAVAGLLVAVGVVLGIVATPEKLTVYAGAPPEERAAPEPPPPDRTPEVLAEVDRLREALQAFAGALDEAASDRARLTAAVADDATTRAETLARIDRGLQGLAARVGRLDTRLDEMARTATAAAPAAKLQPEPPVETPEVEPVPEPEPEPVVEAAAASVPAAKPPIERKSLAALLAKRKRVDPRTQSTRYRLMKGHCRVGFDGGSTLHNFTARSGKVEGAFTLRLDRLTDKPGGALELPVDSLDSGIDARDEEIHSHLAAGDDRTVRCEILSFAKGRPGSEGWIRANAKVRFTIHGQSRVLTAPVELQFTDRQLLHVKGEVKLKMSDFGIEPKPKLGVIKVYDELTAWWDLYAQVDRAGG